MKICYLLPGVGLGEDERERRQVILNAVASSDAEVKVHHIERGPRSIQNAIDEFQAMPEVLNWIIARNEDFDAFIIGCAGDTGLEGVREQSKKPVVGPGEASILLGAIGDKRFSTLTISLERARLKRRLVREAGLAEHRLVSSHSMGIAVLDLYKDLDHTQARLVEILKDARANGAETMLIGCMSVAFMEPRRLAEASAEADLPLVNPIVCAVKLAEALIAMRNYGKAA